MVIQEIVPEFIPGAKIKVIGVGGAGNKTLKRMIQEGLDGVEFVAVNTDTQDLWLFDEQVRKVNIGLNITIIKNIAIITTLFMLHMIKLELLLKSMINI